MEQLNVATQSVDKPLPIDPQERRAAELRRAFQRVIGHKPTLAQRLARDDAAWWQARAEAVRLDPTVSHNDRVRIQRTADRMRRAFHELVGERPKKTRPDPILAAILARKAAQTP
jgi:hypothetical protein